MAYRASKSLTFLILILSYSAITLADDSSKTEIHQQDVLVPGKSPESSDSLPIKFGGYIESYYAYDFNQPTQRDREFTTQPARHNEFNINLAYLDAKLDTDRIRGRLALQLGTSVQANYANEPTVGQFSGPTLSRLLQEAFIGYRVSDKLWIDAGIYFSHIGFEYWISKENYTLTRSLASDFSPYYQSGVRATYAWSDSFTTQLHLINGWQNISEDNGNKALGIQLEYLPSDRVTLTYNNFFGNESGSQSRLLNDFLAEIKLTESLSLGLIYDIGIQRGNTKDSVWQTYCVLLKKQFTPIFSIGLRGEQYFDKNQVIAKTGTGNGFQVSGASVNADFALHKQLLVRSEFRQFWSADPIYPNDTGRSQTDSIVTTSMSLWF